MPKRSNLLLKDTAGATSIEYGLIAGLIACGLILSLGTLGTRLGNVFSAVASGLGDGSAQRTTPPAATNNRVGG